MNWYFFGAALVVYSIIAVGLFALLGNCEHCGSLVFAFCHDEEVNEARRKAYKVCRICKNKTAVEAINDVGKGVWFKDDGGDKKI